MEEQNSGPSRLTQQSSPVNRRGPDGQIADRSADRRWSRVLSNLGSFTRPHISSQQALISARESLRAADGEDEWELPLDPTREGSRASRQIAQLDERRSEIKDAIAASGPSPELLAELENVDREHQPLRKALHEALMVTATESSSKPPRLVRGHT